MSSLNHGSDQLTNGFFVTLETKRLKEKLSQSFEVITKIKVRFNVFWALLDNIYDYMCLLLDFTVIPDRQLRVKGEYTN